MSASFSAANQAKLALKMKLSQHSWYKSAAVEADGDEWCVVITTSKIDDRVKKTVPVVYEGVSIKTMNGK
jgi:hypothetical protein